MQPNTQISQTQIDIENRILRACKHASRKRSEVKLIAVSKRQEADRIQASLEAGFRCFGENQVQEALTRWLPLTSIYPDLELHLIGALQSNKAADAVRLFDVIHTIDRDKIAKAVSVEMKKQNKQLLLRNKQYGLHKKQRMMHYWKNYVRQVSVVQQVVMMYKKVSPH